MDSRERDAGETPAPATPQAQQRLRAAGLRVTSARLISLRLAPELLRARGRLTAADLHEAARRLGCCIPRSTFHNVLKDLTAADLLPGPR